MQKGRLNRDDGCDRQQHAQGLYIRQSTPVLFHQLQHGFGDLDIELQFSGGYRQFAQAWQQTSSADFDIRWDDEITALPADRAVWLCGWDNRWRAHLTSTVREYDVAINADAVRFGDADLQRAAHAVVVTARHPLNPQLSLAWIATDNPAALPGLGRKLPHYGKYSYLGFTGDEPVNVAKGQWPVVRSPMSVLLPPAED